MDALGHRLEISIIATTWEVIGIRRISLDGKVAESLPKAPDGPFPGGHGHNGLPGLPGGSAGALFGVVSSIVGSENLAISANGGSGGPGQAGGNGATGLDGATPGHPSGNCDIDAYERAGFRLVNNEQWGCGSGRCHNYKIFGHDGMNGGNAGSCGVGGQGGLSGQIIVISLKDNSMVAEAQMELLALLGLAGSTEVIEAYHVGNRGENHGVLGLRI